LRAVASLSPGTGSAFSVLPPENATGNWVKVVQRVPVRLAISDAPEIEVCRCAPGLSADVSVDTQHHRAPLRRRRSDAARPSGTTHLMSTPASNAP
jgi:membrane fusion protein (multidrug efflux system)